MTRAFISGCAGTTLNRDEVSFFKEHDPWGLILFARNIDTPQQIRDLTNAFREAVGRTDAPVLVDQEGGRVQRLKPPHWSKYPAPKLFGDIYRENQQAGLRATYLGAQLIADDLQAVGITVDCIPCLDVARPETVDAIGDRALSDDPDVVAILGKAMIEGALAGGVLPVMKHMPGHGRAVVDSHLELPKVNASLAELDASDFVPFKALSGTAMGMTAHILFEAVDGNRPGTQSADVIDGIIRQTIGFDGLLMSDDISMKALGDTLFNRCKRTFAAGCDLVLHCNGEMEEMLEVAGAAPVLSGKSATRCEIALAQELPDRSDFDRKAAENEFAALTGWSGV